MSKVSAKWERIKRAVEIRDEMKSETLIFGNGDVQDVADARQKVKETGCDGVMFGRAIFGNPWLFRDKENIVQKGSQDFSSEKSSDIPAEHGQTFLHKNPAPSLEERLNVLVEHTKLFEKLFACPPEALAKGERYKNFAIMKKHFKAYVNGFPGASELRQELMETESADEVEKVVAKFLKGE